MLAHSCVLFHTFHTEKREFTPKLYQIVLELPEKKPPLFQNDPNENVNTKNSDSISIGLSCECHMFEILACSIVRIWKEHETHEVLPMFEFGILEGKRSNVSQKK